MKHRTLLLVTLLALCVTLTGCGGGGSPSKVVQEFYAALQKNDTQALEKVATPETMQMLNNPLMGEMMKQQLGGLGKLTIKGETINGDSATVKVDFEKDKNTPDFNLKKVDGKWKVHMQ